MTCHGDGSEHIVASRHDCSHFASLQSLDDWVSLGLQFVLHDQQTEELEVALNLVSSDCLRSSIGKVWKLFDGQGNDTVSFFGVLHQYFFKVERHGSSLAQGRNHLRRSFDERFELSIDLVLANHAHSLER